MKNVIYRLFFVIELVFSSNGGRGKNPDWLTYPFLIQSVTCDPVTCDKGGITCTSLSHSHILSRHGRCNKNNNVQYFNNV